MADGEADGGRQIFVRSRTGFPLRGEVMVSGQQIAWGISVSHAFAARDLTVVRFQLGRCALISPHLRRSCCSAIRQALFMPQRPAAGVWM